MVTWIRNWISDCSMMVLQASPRSGLEEICLVPWTSWSWPRREGLGRGDEKGVMAWKCLKGMTCHQTLVLIRIPYYSNHADSRVTMLPPCPGFAGCVSIFQAITTWVSVVWMSRGAPKTFLVEEVGRSERKTGQWMSMDHTHPYTSMRHCVYKYYTIYNTIHIF